MLWEAAQFRRRFFDLEDLAEQMDRLRGFPEVDMGKTSSPVTLDDGSVLSGALTGNPRMGGRVWLGEDDAHDAAVETVEAADGTG